MVNSAERDSALKDIAICHARKGTAIRTQEAIETVLTIRDPAEQSRAFATLSFELIKICDLPSTDPNQGSLKQLLNMIHPTLLGQST